MGHMKKILLFVVLAGFFGSINAQQTFPLQMEGEYLCETRYGCAAPFKLIIERDTTDPTRFHFIDSCPNFWSGLINVRMYQSIVTQLNTFVGNTPNCIFQGTFYPSSDSLYTYRLAMGCGSGCNCLLKYKCKKVIPVGLAENKLKKLQLLPNPVRENLQVKYLNGLLNYSIYNSLGALAKSGQLTESNAQIEVIALPKGIYFIQFEQEGLQYTEKFVKE